MTRVMTQKQHVARLKRTVRWLRCESTIKEIIEDHDTAEQMTKARESIEWAIGQLERMAAREGE